MKKNILLKLLITFIMLFTFFYINAEEVQASAISNSLAGAGDFIQDGVEDGKNHPTLDDTSLQQLSDTLYNALLVIAIIVAVIIGLVIGIQFMTGSVAQKAKIKETLIPYIAGCVVIFGAFGIWKMVVTILGQAA